MTGLEEGGGGVVRRGRESFDEGDLDRSVPATALTGEKTGIPGGATWGRGEPLGSPIDEVRGGIGLMEMTGELYLPKNGVRRGHFVARGFRQRWPKYFLRASGGFALLLRMFTGIVEETGKVVALEASANAWQLQVRARIALQGVAPGDSIAVNGCCLTVTRFDAEHLFFDVLEETRRLTNFAALGAGAPVNLERSLAFGGKLGGHFVSGHIDGVGTIEVFEPRGRDYYLRVRAPAGGGRYLIHKGSIAIDGISLTVAEVEADTFAVWLIPHTVSLTNLREKRAGDPVNLEFDLLGKYVEKLTAYRST